MKAHVMLLTALTAAVVLSACGAADTADQTPEDAAATPALDTMAGPGVPTEPLPPDDGAVQAVAATLAEWTVTLSQDSVSAGAIAFNVRNTGQQTHRFEVEGNGEEWSTDDVAPGGDVTMTISLSPGEYQVYCPIVQGGVNHAERGMTTTLRVR